MSLDWLAQVFGEGGPLDYWVSIGVFAFGLIWGSFLNVCIYRMPLRLSIVKPRSYCLSCKQTVKSYHNLPVFSYLFLRGKCAYCSKPISVRYPLVELATATLFLIAYMEDGLGLPWVFDAFLMASLLVLIFTDLDHQILPNRITYSGILVGLASSLVREDITLTESVIASVGGGGFLLATAFIYLKLRKQEGMGMGDVKMIAMIGAFLGLEKMLVTLVLGSLLGLIIGSTVLLVSRKGFKHPIPFGTFLGIAAMISRYAGDFIFQSWNGLMIRVGGILY